MKKTRQKSPKQPVIIVCGPTATGKSDLAVRIALDIKKKNGGGKNAPVGEVISADSRQVYKGLDIGTGKITKREMKGVRHHLIDVVDPRIPANSPRRYSVETWRSAASAAIDEIASRGNVPIICGGTGFYIEALIDGITYPDVPPNIPLRKKLAKKPVEELFKMLQKLDPKRAADMKNGRGKNSTETRGSGDDKNPHRLIRAIEIATALGKVPPLQIRKGATKLLKSASPYSPIFIGLELPPEELKKKIALRLQKRLKQGMIAEARDLHVNGLSYKRMNELGLEYRYLARFLQTKQTRADRAEMIEKLRTEIWHYARRQISWFKRDKRIKWFTPDKTVFWSDYILPNP